MPRAARHIPDAVQEGITLDDDALSHELYPQARRPQVCLGEEQFHTPDWLIDAAFRAFARWEIAVNEPFVGCYVPLAHYGRDRRVRSVMIEIRRDTYQAEAGRDRAVGLTALATHPGAPVAESSV